MSDAPSWPSLYNPLIELFPLQHRNPVQPAGHYLHDPHDVFRFTLYWTLIFYTPSYILCGTYAFLNLAFPPRAPHKPQKTRAPRSDSRPSYRPVSDGDNIPMRRYPRQLSAHLQSQPHVTLASRSPAKQNEKRSRLTFALLVLFVFALFALAGAVVGSAIVGYVLAGLFKAAKYNMSTWIPFIGGLLQTLVGFLGLWPTVIDII
ncbi:hypothetical protein BV20DRAFT_967425 [Pilatotrama ljubarskyi]|nr:hypothetical protein BV20DRAFT_967425 [Pilatotrama ljubarskyi]